MAPDLNQIRNWAWSKCRIFLHQIAPAFRTALKKNIKFGLIQKKETMPYTKVMIHYIWATKNRSPIITTALKPKLLDHIKENSIKKGIFINTLNCVNDHIHLLISLGTEQTIAKVAQLIKGESSYWVNKQKIIPQKFEWQDDYIALSVSGSAVGIVRQYIANQEEHHKKKSFSDEYDEFLEMNGFDKDDFG